MKLEDLRALREAKRRELSRRETAGKQVQVIVGMGSCGIAAGAKESFDAFVDELARHGREDVIVKQSGCMGLCYAEPTAEVIAPGMPPTIYGKVDQEVAREIVRKHILEGTLVDGHVYDRPAADILDDTSGAGGE